MKTGKLIYNAVFCIGLLFQVKEKKMTLADVQDVLGKDYYEWYITYYMPIDDMNKTAKQAQLLEIYGRYEEAIAKQKQLIDKAEYYADLYKKYQIEYQSANKRFNIARGSVGGITRVINEYKTLNAKGLLPIVTTNVSDDLLEVKRSIKWINQNRLSAAEYEEVLNEAVWEFKSLESEKEANLDTAKNNYKSALNAREQAYDALNKSKGLNQQAAQQAAEADKLIKRYNSLQREVIDYQLFSLFLSF